MEYKRTKGTDKDFIDNCFLLDQDLDRRVGKVIQREKYSQYNQLDQIQQAIVVYYNAQPTGGGAIRKYDEEGSRMSKNQVSIKPCMENVCRIINDYMSNEFYIGSHHCSEFRK